MIGHTGGAVLRAVRAAGAARATDRTLLAQYAAGDEGAFATLVERHADMVLGVCRRTLPTAQDAEDACQAVFLILARKAGGRWDESVANYLYTTARNVATNAVRSAARRARREAVAAAAATPMHPLARVSAREWFDALDEELDRLPAIYREPLVLCYLEGLARDEAAARLGVPVATLKSQLDRGRKKLAVALTRRGVALGTGLLAIAVSAPAGACPPRLVSAVLAAASGSVPKAVGELVKGVAVNATLGRVKLAVAGAFGLVAVGFALAVPADPPESAPDTGEKAAMPAPKGEPVKGAKKEEPEKEKRIEVKGVVLGPDDKPVPGAKLYLSNYSDGAVPAPQAAAGADGTFAFTAAENKCVELIATAPGFGIASSYLQTRPLPPVALRLTADEPIRGKVVNLEGKPVAGVSVRVARLFQPRNEKTLDAWLKHAPTAKPGDPDLEGLWGWPKHEPGRLAPATTGRDGTFEIRGAGRDRVAVLRISGPTTAVHEWNVVTRKVERFTRRSSIGLGDQPFQGAEPLLVGATVPVTTGRVTDTDTGEPIPGAVLSVVGLSQQQMAIQGLNVVADKDGRFTLPGLPVGTPYVAVSAGPPPGAPYYPVQKVVPDDPVARAAFDVKLTRGIFATVTVVDKGTGQPVGAQVHYGVFAAENPNVKRIPDLSGFFDGAPVTLGPLGRAEYRLLVMPGKGLIGATVYGKGEYLTGVGAEAFAEYRKGNELDGLAGGLPLDVGMRNTLARIDVPAGAKEFRVTLELDRGVTASVRLVDAGGKPVTGCACRGLSDPPFQNEDWSEPAAGATLTAVALRPGQKRRVTFVHAGRKLAGSAVVVGGAKEPVEVRMEPWGEMTGRIVGADGAPVKGPHTVAWDTVPGSRGRSDPLSLRPPRTHYAEVAADGRFRIDGLVPGLTYQLGVQGPKAMCDSSAKAVAKSGETIDLGDVAFSFDAP
jgi:RNA polymerase sigma factor (sigma-70 family)